MNNEKNSRNFLQEISKYYPKTEKISLVIVSHLLPDKCDFIDVLSQSFRIGYIIPKPKSIDQSVYAILAKKYSVLNLNREEILMQKEKVIEKLRVLGKFIIIDIGGYFSPIAYLLKQEFGEDFIGVIEDTENGHQKYERYPQNFPIISVARSILKEPEDMLIGESIVFSADAILREMNMLLLNNYAVVLGFGKIGKSIARSLQGKNIQLGVFDIDPLKGLEVLSLGYALLGREGALSRADIIFCATGNVSLKGDDYKLLKNNAIIVSVTSSDDELDMQYLYKYYQKSMITPLIARYSRNNQNIYMLNNGNAINFIHNAVVGEYIYLVQAEIIHCIFDLLHHNYPKDSISSISKMNKKYIASLWLQYFHI